MSGYLVVRGARQHNLKNLDVELPRNRLVVITGPSGSGKSSLAFDTIYAEGQRRYVESLSVYARQFLDRLPKPDVESIEGLSPAICVQQQGPGRNPRSTVGTITEVYDYLRLLYARVGRPHCPRCGRPISAHTVPEMVDRVLSLPEGTRFAVLAPVVRRRRGAFAELLGRLRRDGFVRARIDGDAVELDSEARLDSRREHDIDVFVDRLSIKDGIRQRLSESVELALSLADGMVRVAPVQGEELLLSERFACVECGVGLPEIGPRTFSFNSPDGACPGCDGLGQVQRYEAALAVPDPTLSIAEGAVAPWGRPNAAYHRHMVAALEGLGIDLGSPWEDLPEATRRLLLQGGGGAEGFEGILPGLERRARDYARRKREEGASEERTFEYIEEELGRYAHMRRCGDCGGARLRPEALAVTVGGRNICELTALSIADAARVLDGLELTAAEKPVAERIVRDVRGRLRFLVDVGLDYVSLDRRAATLSGGESQRIRLATQIGAGLVGVLYVLDEPSIGLHPRDVGRLVATLEALRDRGNTVLVVEHDPQIIVAADHVIDMGPGAGKHGGQVVAAGTPAALQGDPRSVTGAYLSGRRCIAVPKRRRRARGAIRIRDARVHNLRGIDVDFPLGCLVAVTGVSGSGKSSLVVDTLLPAVQARLAGTKLEVPAQIEGIGGVDKVVAIDQSPIGRTPRSNPATYTGVSTTLRELFAGLPEARTRGYKPGRFSFNIKGGRCEACQGGGLVRIEMHFLPDVHVLCDQCGGRRFNRETLEVRYRGLSIAEVLGLSVEDALELLSAIPKVRERLETLRAVGLGYLELGQSATTLSGGEAQRVKLARELARRATGRTLYVLDEPTTGLHPVDVELLVEVLGHLVDAGNTVVVIEHDLEVVKVADHVIDLGPEGGEGGGALVAAGTPEQLTTIEGSHTGRYLRPLVSPARGAGAPA